MTQTLGRAELQAVSDRLQDAFTRRDPVAFAACHTLEGVVESPMFATLRGRKAIEEAQRAFFTSFPDATMTVDATVIDPPYVAVFATMHATHVNEFFGLPGTWARPVAETDTGCRGSTTRAASAFSCAGVSASAAAVYVL